MSKEAELSGDWNDIKARLKARFELLNTKERQLPEEIREALIVRLQGILGKSKSEIQSIISELISY